MKIILILSIIMCFGFLGYLYKSRLQYELNFLKYVYSFHQFYSSNINLFKNNLVEIINSYIIMQKNKNAEYNQIFQNNGNIYSYNENFIDNVVKDIDTKKIIIEYFNSLGKAEYEFEKQKNIDFDKFFQYKIDEFSNICKNKGGLYFKLMLAIGAIVAIVLW